jgi:hypothetical protein
MSLSTKAVDIHFTMFLAHNQSILRVHAHVLATSALKEYFCPVAYTVAGFGVVIA